MVFLVSLIKRIEPLQAPTWNIEERKRNIDNKENGLKRSQHNVALSPLLGHFRFFLLESSLNSSINLTRKVEKRSITSMRLELELLVVRQGLLLGLVHLLHP